MVLNLVKKNSNMYQFVTATWNAIKGECPHHCSYCYMKKWGPQRPIRLDNKELKSDLGESNFIFVGSSTDMWAEEVPDEWIEKVLEHCREYPDNRYLFQSKNPGRFKKFLGKFPDEIVFGTTIESNRDYPGVYNDSPKIKERVASLAELRRKGNEVMVTIEPILNFDVKELTLMIKEIEPCWVNLGADSQGNKMNEPSWKKIIDLSAELRKFTTIENKKNLTRLEKK